MKQRTIRAILIFLKIPIFDKIVCLGKLIMRKITGKKSRVVICLNTTQNLLMGNYTYVPGVTILPYAHQMRGKWHLDVIWHILKSSF